MKNFLDFFQLNGTPSIAFVNAFKHNKEDIKWYYENKDIYIKESELIPKK